MAAKITLSDHAALSSLRPLFRPGARFLFGVSLFLVMAAGSLSAAAVTVQGRKILVDGHDFTIKGVCYSPEPPGYDWQYVWATNARIYDTDLGLIKAMGANTVRTYQERNITKEFLDAAYAHGIYVIAGWGEGLWGQDFSVPATRAGYVASFKNFVNTWKDHPAILMWCFGNEISPYHTSSTTGWYTLVQEAAAAAHSVDPDHLVTTSNAETAEVGSASCSSTDADLSALDVWGVNIYRGRSFGELFTTMSTLTAKPYYISEWGCDAYNGVLGREDKSMQDDYVGSQWAEISANLAADGMSCAGGTLFEWIDEWWKGASVPGNPGTIGSGGVQGPNVQDTATDWGPNGAYTEDPNMNEEWWGIVSTGLGEGERSPRPAFFTLRGLWGGAGIPAAAAGSALFQSEVRNFPNPFIPGTASTRIEFTVNGNPSVEVAIFDLEGRKISNVEIAHRHDSGLVAADWTGRDESSSPVAAGLYIARVKAKTAYREETRYRKIAVVK